MDPLARIKRVCQPGLDERALRVAVLRELRAIVPFDAYAWLITDPRSCVGWSPVAEIPDVADLPEVIRAKYATALNRWTGLRAGVARTMASTSIEDRAQSPLWCLVESRYAISDIVSVVLGDRSGTWGFIDLWRRGGVFQSNECDLIGAVASLVTPALRQALLSTFTDADTAADDGPVVLLLDNDLRLVAQTDETDDYLAALLPADPGRTAVPAAALNVAAQLCAAEAGVDGHPPEARIYVPGRSWRTIRAGRVGARDSDGTTIAVTIEPARPADRTSIYACVADLSPREFDVLDAITAGNDTRHVAQLLGITEHTVQDHLKAIFAKTGSDSRRQLAANATGTR